MATVTDEGSVRTIRTAIPGKSFLFALALACAGIQGCSMEDAPAGPGAAEAPADELSVAALVASNDQKSSSVSKDLGNGCRLYAIVAEAGSRARGNVWISCNKMQSKIRVASTLHDSYLVGKNGDATCRNVYWCGTGNVYIPNPSGIRKYTIDGIYIPGGGAKEQYVRTSASF